MAVKRNVLLPDVIQCCAERGKQTSGIIEVFLFVVISNNQIERKLIVLRRIYIYFSIHC